MYVVDITFCAEPYDLPDDASDIVDSVLGALRLNGQILGREFAVAKDQHCLMVRVMTPAPDSLETSRHNGYVASALARAQQDRLAFSTRLVASEPTGGPLCRCRARTSLILYTTYLSLESPLRCGDCFNPVPLYAIPLPDKGEYIDIVTWQSDYQACDTLQMNTATGERFALRELSRVDSSLTRRGLGICQEITRELEVPAYYYLYRSRGVSVGRERRRSCPVCHGEWLLPHPWHGLFDFRCERCHLVSNVAFSIA